VFKRSKTRKSDSPAQDAPAAEPVTETVAVTEAPAEPSRVTASANAIAGVFNTREMTGVALLAFIKGEGRASEAEASSRQFDVLDVCLLMSWPAQPVLDAISGADSLLPVLRVCQMLGISGPSGLDREIQRGNAPAPAIRWKAGAAFWRRSEVLAAAPRFTSPSVGARFV
jgi:hypothetical protein